jgi:hypothetical protein
MTARVIQTQIPPAIIPQLSGALVLWAESPEEARTFLLRAGSDPHFPAIQKIFVAKRSPTVRGNRYIHGEYWPTSNDGAVDVYRSAVAAPRKIVELVQWCTGDVMLSRGETPIVVLEDTTHIVRMNLFQRFPRLARASSLGVPSAVFQGTRGLDLSKRGDVWALHRYLAAFRALSLIHPNSPTLPIWYSPNQPRQELDAERELIAYVRQLIEGHFDDAKQIVDTRLDQVTQLLDPGVNGAPVPDVPSIDHTSEKDVVVKIGAKPDVKSWREKGSGQMDPYLGMIVAAKYLYCFDAAGRQVRRLRVDFTYLPPDFWFFKDGAAATALYKRLPMTFPDEVRFLG